MEEFDYWYHLEFVNTFWKNAQMICNYCSKPVKRDLDLDNPDRATIDHIVPLSKGGSRYCVDNIVVCCRLCNITKGPLDVLEFKRKREEIK